MIVGENLPFIRDYVKALNDIIKQNNPGFELARLQVAWLNFIILGILVIKSANWAKISRFSLGSYQDKAISWMFRRAKILWSYLLLASTKAVLERYKIKDVHLELNGSDHQRAKTTTEINWKSYEGWHQLVKQPGIDGSVNGLTLSLLCDHALLLHSEQINLFKNHNY